MMIGAFRRVGLASVVLLSAFVMCLQLQLAHAQAADHPTCAPFRAKWVLVNSGTDLDAMDGVIARIPGLCPVLTSDAKKRRVAAAKEAEIARAEAAAARVAATQKQAAIEKARREEEARTREATERERQAIEAAQRANDPCLQARADWSYVQNGSEAALSAYIAALPPVCSAFRAQGQEKLDKLVAARRTAESQQRAAAQAAEQRRQAAQQAAAQTAGITAAAKATGIEGKWKDPINVTTSRKSFLESRCYLGQDIVVSGGQVIMGGYPAAILKVSGTTVTTDGVTFIVEGDNMRKKFLTSGEEFLFWRCP